MKIASLCLIFTTIKFSGFSDTLFQEYGINLVGAASSREYRSGAMLLSFIAAGSRSHKGRYPSRTKVSL